VRTGVSVECQFCGHAEDVNVALADAWWEWTCGDCGQSNSVLTSGRIGSKLLHRARFEFTKREDYSLTAVLAAMALECEASYLFQKWRRIDERALRWKASWKDEELETEYRRLGPSISDKLNGVARLLSGSPLSDFEPTPALAAELDRVDGGDDPARFLQESVFWPRNRVLHWGHMSFAAEAAERCFKIAVLGIRLLGEMNDQRPMPQVVQGPPEGWSWGGPSTGFLPDSR